MFKAASLAVIVVGIAASLTMCGTTAEMNQEKMSMRELKALVDQGNFSESRTRIKAALAQTDRFTAEERSALAFEIDRMDRIERDFRAQPDDVYEFIRKYYPEMTQQDIHNGETSGALEFKIIDGEKRYFAWAGRNLFRIDAAMAQRWRELHPDGSLTSGSGASLDLDKHNAEVIAAAAVSETGFVLPKRIKITQSMSLEPGVVPPGEKVRCWIPYPRLIPGRQEDITLHGTQPEAHTLAPADALQRTIYMESVAPEAGPLTFSVSYTVTSRGFHRRIDPDRIEMAEPSSEILDFLKEEPPHIVFTPTLRTLSKEIIGSETNPYRKAQLLFAWINDNIPWASAREYSTIRCIPEYALANGHGDCGIQTLLFITLCRMNGIPARWQSGWELQPPDDSMHDWGMIYFEGVGWVPMDVTYGLRQSDDPVLKWFYLSGMDSYRIIFNDSFSKAFFPPKTHVRSETIDSQRGEMEWVGGNLYFSDWTWKFEWELIGDEMATPKK